MAKIGRRAGGRGGVQRVSPIKPGLRGARNWATAQIRAARYSSRGLWRLILSVTCLFLVLLFGALWLGGFLPQAHQASKDFLRGRLVSLGFVVERVDVMGEGRLREEDVRLALGVREGDYLFGLDIHAAQDRVEALNWVDRAVVRRLWPDRIVVQIIERKPYALWQDEGHLKLVDHKGVVIQAIEPEDRPDIMLIVGQNAPEHIKDVESILEVSPILARRASAFVRTPSGRWDVHLDQGRLQIKMPRGDIGPTLSFLKNLQEHKQILDRDISILDLRIPDRVTMRPGGASPV